MTPLSSAIPCPGRFHLPRQIVMNYSSSFTTVAFVIERGLEMKVLSLWKTRLIPEIGLVEKY